MKIPKDKEPEDLTYAECVDLAEKTPEKGRRGGAAKGGAKAEATGAKKSTTKKPATKKTAKKKPSAKKK